MRLGSQISEARTIDMADTSVAKPLKFNLQQLPNFKINLKNFQKIVI